MKLRKFLVSAAVVLALGAVGCGGGPIEEQTSTEEVGPSSTSSATTEEVTSSSTAEESSSTSQAPAVNRIRINNAPEYVVVNEPINLDDYVEVILVGNIVSKEYNVEVAAAYQDKVAVDGHTIYALAEGTINVNIKAGKKSAKFSTKGMSALRLKFAEAAEKVSYEWAMFTLDDEKNLALGVVHRTDYTWFDSFAGDDDDESVVYPGGFMKCQNGKTYEYIINNNNEVEPIELMGNDFSNYFCNFPFALSGNNFETRTIVDEETSEEAEILVMPANTPNAWGYPNYFPNKIDEFAYTLGIWGLDDEYAFGDLVVSELTLEMEDESEYETFLFELQVNDITGDEPVYEGSFYYILYTEAEDTEITEVREYIDAGKFPEPIKFDELKTFVKDVVDEKKAYTATTVAGWFDGETNEQIALPENTDYKLIEQIGNEFPVGSEVDYVNATIAYQEYTLGGVEGTIKEGCLEKDNKLFSFTNYDEATAAYGDTLTAAEMEGSEGKSIWDSIYTIGVLNNDKAFEGFTVVTRTEEEGVITLETNGKNAGENFMFYAFANTALGYLANDEVFFAYVLGSGDDKTPMYEYLDVKVVIEEDKLTLELVFDFDEFYYGLTTVYSGIGEDKVPDLSGIVFPTASGEAE